MVYALRDTLPQSSRVQSLLFGGSKMIIDTEECKLCKCFVSTDQGTLFMGFIEEKITIFICFECQDKQNNRS